MCNEIACLLRTETFGTSVVGPYFAKLRPGKRREKLLDDGHWRSLRFFWPTGEEPITLEGSCFLIKLLFTLSRAKMQKIVGCRIVPGASRAFGPGFGALSGNASALVKGVSPQHGTQNRTQNPRHLTDCWYRPYRSLSERLSIWTARCIVPFSEFRFNFPRVPVSIIEARHQQPRAVAPFLCSSTRHRHRGI